MRAIRSCIRMNGRMPTPRKGWQPSASLAYSRPRSDHFLALWEEFEARESNEAKFASVFDRMEPILQNYVNEGFTWKQNHVTYEMVLAKNGHIADGSQVLWEFVRCVLDDARRKGFFAPSANPGPA